MQSLEVIRADQVDVGIDEHGPDLFIIAGRPEAQPPAVGVAALDDAKEFQAVGIGDGAFAAPFEVVAPVVADEGHEIDGDL